MKVVLDAPDRLVLRDLQISAALALGAFTALPMLMAWGYFRNGIISGGIILSVIALILLIGCFGAFVRPITITLDRPGAVITVVERSIFGAKRSQHVLKGIRGASTQSKVIRHKVDALARERRRPEPRVHRAVLVHVNGHHIPLSEVYGSEKAAQTAASAINRWLGET